MGTFKTETSFQQSENLIEETSFFIDSDDGLQFLLYHGEPS